MKNMEAKNHIVSKGDIAMKSSTKKHLAALFAAGLLTAVPLGAEAALSQQDEAALARPHSGIFYLIDWYNKALVLVPEHGVVRAKKEMAQEEIKAVQAKQEEQRREQELRQRVG